MDRKAPFSTLKYWFLATLLLETFYFRFSQPIKWLIPYRGKKSRGKFSLGKHLVTSEKLVTFPRLIFQIRHFPRPIFKIKRTFMSGSAFFQRKVVLLVWDFSNWAWRSALLVSLIHGIGCCKYTPLWISQNKKFLYKLIFRDYKTFRRIPEEF